jgi:hypothetical protein
VVERCFELEAAAADKAGLREQFDRGLFGHLAASFVGFLPVEKHLAGEDERLGFFAGGSQAAFDNQLIETHLGHRLPLALHDEIGQGAQGLSLSIETGE